jgi:3-oxoacyl-[acyl-carrier-protein] synthase-3
VGAMRLEQVYIAGTGCWLPDAMTLEEAERRGLCERRLVWGTGITSVRVAVDPAPEMAVRAARSALAEAACRPEEVALILHAAAYYQGHDMWSPASYVQRYTVGNRCPSIEVRQMSNGGMAALELATSYLAADRTRGFALVTTGDRFCLPGYDRWRTDPGTVCGDGGTAIVLSNVRGPLQVHSVASVSDSSLEQMGRGDDPFADAPLARRAPIDLDRYAASVVREIGLDTLLDRIEAGQQEVVERTLADAKVDMGDIAWFILPALGQTRLRAHFYRPLGLDPARTTWSWGRTTGHLGAGDQFAGLNHLVATGKMAPGDRGLLLGVGSGFTWSAAVVEFLPGDGSAA